MSIRATAFAFCLLATAAVAGETRIVSTTGGGKTVISTTERREVADPSGLRIEEISDEESVTTLLAEDGTAKSVEVAAKDGGTALMVCDGSGVDVSGIWRGKPVKARCDLQGGRFYGRSFGLAARAFAKGGFKSLEFAYIRLDKPSKAMIMQLQPEGPAEFKGRRAAKVKLSPAGALSVFWKAHLLVDEEGNILRFEGNLGPGTPDFVSELVEVRP